MTKEQKLVELLQQIETTMRDIDLWMGYPPQPEAFESLEPFALDTMEAHEWLQWILIPRLYALMEQSHPLPVEFNIHPYFEEVWREHKEGEVAGRYNPLLAHLRSLDALFTAE